MSIFNYHKIQTHNWINEPVSIDQIITATQSRKIRKRNSDEGPHLRPNVRFVSNTSKIWIFTFGCKLPCLGGLLKTWSWFWRWSQTSYPSQHSTFILICHSVNWIRVKMVDCQEEPSNYSDLYARLDPIWIYVYKTGWFPLNSYTNTNEIWKATVGTPVQL